MLEPIYDDFAEKLKLEITVIPIDIISLFIYKLYFLF